MAVPKVFISSTFYDLKQVRNNIGSFINGLGYDTVMNEKSEIAYTEDVTLEQSCYNELLGCDMVVCVIGNRFGSESEFNELSITMNEINNAIKNKKKVYVFVSKDIFIENKTYEKNKESGTFKSAYTDNIIIHEYVSKIKNNRRIVICDFETTDQIVDTLKMQWAGLFQNLLSRDAALTDAKTLNDLQESADKIQSIVNDLCDRQEDFFNKINAAVIYPNRIMLRLKQILGFQNMSFFLKNIEAIDEFMSALGFIQKELDFEELEYERIYIKNNLETNKTIKLSSKLFEKDGKIKNDITKQAADELIIYEESDVDDIPF